MIKTNSNDEGPTPEKIFETFFAFASTRVLVTGIDLEVFTHIANGCHTSAEIAKAASSSERGMEILLNSLVGLNYITKADGTYHLTLLAEKFLVKGRPAYFGDFVQHADLLWEPWSNLSEVVRTGTPFKRLETEQGPAFFQEMVSRLFPMSYPGAKAAAEALGVGIAWKNLNVLDIGAGSGAWGIAFAESDPETRVTSHDWPDILEVTKKFVERFNLGQKFSYLEGDINEVDFGQDHYDLVILGHICHTEGAERTRRLFSRAHRSLRRDGRLLIADMIPDDDRRTAVFPLLFAVNMLINSTEGNTFTMAEYREWLKDAGFADVTTIDAPGPSPLIVASR